MNELTKAIGLPKCKTELNKKELTDRVLLLESIISEILKELGCNLNFVELHEGWKSTLSKAIAPETQPKK